MINFLETLLMDEYERKARLYPAIRLWCMNWCFFRLIG